MRARATCQSALHAPATQVGSLGQQGYTYYVWWQTQSTQCRRQPAGFQRILRLSRHAATVRAAAVSPSHGLLACGDDSGLVSVTDLSEVLISDPL